MQTKNDEWIEKIRELQNEMQVFQAAGIRTPEIGYAIHYLRTARFWIQEDKANVASNPGEVAQPS
jgi:predicted transcriptional regulator